MQYPFRSAAEQAAFERMPSTPFAFDDRPYMNTARVCISGNYEPRDLDAKKLLDLSGAADNLWWLEFNRSRETNVF